MKKIWLEIDIEETFGEEAWTAIEQPKGFIDAGILVPKESTCSHTVKKPHAKGEWLEVWVTVKSPNFDDAVQFYKKKERVLAVEIEN
ncbi:MAG: hypothetical protein ACE5FY_02750 [Nitrospiria bacterium]